MSSIAVSEEWIAISIGDGLRVVHVISNKLITLELPPVRQAVKENKPKTTASEETKNYVAGLIFSSCGKWFAAYSSAKQIIIWETATWTLVSERYMPKAASSIRFTPDGLAVIIVDKAGDAVSFSLTNLQSEGEVILGHLSMLLDVLLTRDGKEIITCDRDEKIRVSHYINAYNIISYCLGHKEFVSSLCLLPHDSSRLLSSSGDGTLRLWDFASGQNRVTYDCSSDVRKKLSEHSLSCVSKDDENQNFTIVKKLCCRKLNDNTSLVCALVHGYRGCLVYCITEEDFELIQAVSSEDAILDVCFRNSGELFLRVSKTQSNHIIQCYQYDESCGQFSRILDDSHLTPSVENINQVLISTDEQCVVPNDMTLFLKRRFDNVKDYYEQKKIRLGEQ